MFLRFAFRKSLLYLSIYKIIYYLRSIEITLTNKYLLFNSPILQTFLMAIGEIIGGIAVYLFIRKDFKKQNKRKYFGIQLVKNRANEVRRDGWIKIIILLFFTAFFDFEEFYILNTVLSKITNVSTSINHRFSLITTLVSSLLCTYVLGFKIGRHQKFILISISIIFVVYFGIEVAFSPMDKKFFITFFLNITNLLFITFMDIVERYFGDVDFSNPFGVLAAEGAFLSAMTAIYAIGKDPFGQIKNLYEEYDTGKFVLLLFLLFLYIVLSAGLNVYKVHCNVFLSPVARSLTDYLFNPIYLIYSYFFENDFIYKGEQNITYFLLNEFISIVIIFLGFVYNEYIILSCCNLEHDTSHGIHKRSQLIGNSFDDREGSDEGDEGNDAEEREDSEDNDKKEESIK